MMREEPVVQRIADGKPVVGFDGEPLGTAGQRLEIPEGAAVLVQRAERLGGGTIVLPESELEERTEEIGAPYDTLSIREAPPYSRNVPLEAYLRYWKRLGAGNTNQDDASFVTAGSGPVAGPPAHLPDHEIAELVREGLRRAAGVASHLIETTVKEGTVLLEGYQNDTEARWSAGQAAAAAPGVRELVNMIVVRAA
jgi:hypothetical protein